MNALKLQRNLKDLSPSCIEFYQERTKSVEVKTEDGSIVELHFQQPSVSWSNAVAGAVPVVELTDSEQHGMLMPHSSSQASLK